MNVEGGSNGVPVCMCQYHVVQLADGSIMGSQCIGRHMKGPPVCR